MNYLAHLFLSGEEEDVMIGNFIADFLKNSDLIKVQPSVLKGIILHRAIDQFTDQHPTFRKGNKRLHANHGKYAGVVNDIFYDHLLFSNWNRYTNEPFERFEQRVYARLIRKIHLIPSFRQGSVKSMVHHKWLNQYKSIEGIKDVFLRMRSRVPISANLYSAHISLQEQMEEFNEDFLIFFPECIKFAEEKLNETNLQNES